MVIPWLGFPLKKLLEGLESTSQVMVIRFLILFGPDQTVSHPIDRLHRYLDTPDRDRRLFFPSIA